LLVNYKWLVSFDYKTQLRFYTNFKTEVKNYYSLAKHLVAGFEPAAARYYRSK